MSWGRNEQIGQKLKLTNNVLCLFFFATPGDPHAYSGRLSSAGGGTVDGYMSDGGEAFRLSSGGFSTDPFPPPPGTPSRGRVVSSNCDPTDGYLSEGGASLYARKIQTRIAIEKQKAAEEQRIKLGVDNSIYGSPSHRPSSRPLPGLPDVLNSGGGGGSHSHHPEVGKICKSSRYCTH